MGFRDDVVISLLDQFDLSIMGSRNEQAAVGFRVRFVHCDPSEDVWLPFAEANQLSATDEHLDLPQTES